MTKSSSFLLLTLLSSSFLATTCFIPLFSHPLRHPLSTSPLLPKSTSAQRALDDDALGDIIRRATEELMAEKQASDAKGDDKDEEQQPQQQPQQPVAEETTPKPEMITGKTNSSSPLAEAAELSSDSTKSAGGNKKEKKKKKQKRKGQRAREELKQNSEETPTTPVQNETWEQEKAKFAAEQKLMEEEKAKLAAEQKRIEEEKANIAAEQKRMQEEKAKLAAEQERKENEELKRKEQQQKEEEEEKEKARIAAEMKEKEEEAKRLDEEQRLAEEAKRLELERQEEEDRKAQEAEQEQMRILAEKKRKEEEERIAAEAKQKEEEAARVAEEKRLAEEAKLAELQKKEEEERKEELLENSGKAQASKDTSQGKESNQPQQATTRTVLSDQQKFESVDPLASEGRRSFQSTPQQGSTGPQTPRLSQKHSRYNPDPTIIWGQQRSHDQPRLAGPEEQIRLQEEREAEKAKLAIEAQVAEEQRRKAEEEKAKLEGETQTEGEPQQMEEKVPLDASQEQDAQNENLQPDILPDQLLGLSGEQINSAGNRVNKRWSEATPSESIISQPAPRLSQKHSRYNPDPSIIWGQQRSHDQPRLAGPEEQIRLQEERQAEASKRELQDKIVAKQASGQEAWNDETTQQNDSPDASLLPDQMNIASGEQPAARRPPESAEKRQASKEASEALERGRLARERASERGHRKASYGPDPGIVWSQQRTHEQTRLLGFEEQRRLEQERLAEEEKRALEESIAGNQVPQGEVDKGNNNMISETATLRQQNYIGYSGLNPSGSLWAGHTRKDDPLPLVDPEEQIRHEKAQAAKKKRSSELKATDYDQRKAEQQAESEQDEDTTD